MGCQSCVEGAARFLGLLESQDCEIQLMLGPFLYGRN